MKLKKKKTAKKSRSTPAVKVESRGMTVGRKSGLGVTEFWNKLLAANNRLKLTDKQLAAKVKAEFPLRFTQQPPARVRSFYNRGFGGYGQGRNMRGTPQEIFCYDAKGKVTQHGDWGDSKPDPKRSKLAAKRAAKVWARKAKGGKATDKLKRTTVKTSKAGKKKAAVVRKATKKAAKKASPAKAKKTIRVRSNKPKPAAVDAAA